jgi:hypothetical protein
MCPFTIGQLVSYSPTLAGRGHLVMTDLAKLAPKTTYRVVGIDEGEYVILEGFENAIPNSIHWSEFVALDKR